MMASARALAAYEPLTNEQAAEVLGWTVEAVRGAVRRGDVRSVKHGSRRRIPYDEVKRLALLSAAEI
jgi:excisionase family DNA binding protein